MQFAKCIIMHADDCVPILASHHYLKRWLAVEYDCRWAPLDTGEEWVVYGQLIPL